MSTDDAETDKDAETKAADNDEATDEVTAESEDAAAAKAEESKAEKADKEKTNKKSEPEGGARPATPQRSTSLPLVAAFVAGVLAVAAITAVVVFFLQGKDRGDKLDAIRDSTSAACKFGKDVSVYDYSKNLDDYFTTVKAGATGEFLKEFDDATKALRDAMVQAQVKSWADDVQCGYQSGDQTSAKVLVTLTQYRTNFTQPNPERQFVVVIAQLQKSGDKWLVEKLDSPMLKGAGNGLPGAPAPGNGQQPAPSGQPAPQPGN
ncbi:hypothetical protein OH799_24135 [Nocardia sp. NBC_00881]|uniref:hypothetical protein n=1 Tax=Nocardia sp. NBC_00881 TaxID=2975995 RepID=UPI003865AEF5|nr:hypothetical protein OH799_24135 [Nocardia sp. NBC_00881]